MHDNGIEMAEKTKLETESEEAPGSITFYVNDGKDEVLRFDPSGGIFVNSKLVENDQAVVDAFKSWLFAAQ